MAPPDLVDACRRASERVPIAVLCPRRLPKGGFESPREYGNEPCTYLLNLEPRGSDRQPGSIFHVLLGGVCRPWNLGSRRGQWPIQPSMPADQDLRLIGRTPLDPKRPHKPARRVRLEVIRRARVGPATALVLRNPPYPAGGIHGGHLTVVWNSAGAGYAVTGHPVGLDNTRGRSTRRGIVDRASRVLLDVAASMSTAETSSPGG